MRILNYDSSLGNIDHDDGLYDPIKLKNLKRIVLLTGKNGSGKTRLLKRLQPFGITGPAMAESPLEHYGVDFGEPFRSNGRVGAIAIQLAYSPSTTDAQDPANATPNQLENAASNSTIWANDLPYGLGNSYLLCLQHIHNQYLKAKAIPEHQSTENGAQAIGNYQRINQLLDIFLGVKLGFDEDLNPMLFERSLNSLQLSPGQAVCLKLCLDLYGRKSDEEHAIIILDEPELHLHATVLKSMVDRLLDIPEVVQLWIATHSVPLIADLTCQHFDETSLYLLDAGRVKFANNFPNEVLESIVGTESSRANLRSFSDFPAEIARLRFTAECLTSPDVIGFEAKGKTDPQIGLIAQDLGPLNHRKGKSPKVLEIGVGEGRVLAALNELYPTIANHIDYVGVDIKDESAAQCKRVFSQVYDQPKNRLFFNGGEAALKQYGESVFDFALLCSVLHEIPPESWTGEYFGGEGIVTRALTDTGKLIVVEDYFLPHGERAHNFDYLILDRKALLELFAAKENEIVTTCSTTQGYENRIKSHCIQSNVLGRATNRTKRKTLESIKDTSLSKARQLRGTDAAVGQTFSHGRKLAFYEHQFINATLALENC